MVDSVSLGINLCAGNVVFLHLLIECLAVNTLYGAVDQTALVQLVQDTEDTTCAVALLYTVFLGVRAQLAEARHLAAQLVDVFHLEVCASFLSYCQQVEHGVGASAHGDVQGHGVEECVAGSNVAWQYALVAVLIICISVLNYLACSIFKELDAVLVGSKNGSVAWQAQTDGLGE